MLKTPMGVHPLLAEQSSAGAHWVLHLSVSLFIGLGRAPDVSALCSIGGVGGVQEMATLSAKWRNNPCRPTYCSCYLVQIFLWAGLGPVQTCLRQQKRTNIRLLASNIRCFLYPTCNRTDIFLLVPVCVGRLLNSTAREISIT